jgi:hypothetical protein
VAEPGRRPTGRTDDLRSDAGIRRRLGEALAVTPALIIASIITLVAVLLPSAAAAAPGDDEGGTGTLREQLDAASRGYLDAKAAMDASVVKQQELTVELASLEAELATESETVAAIAGAVYKTGGLGQLAGLLSSDSPEHFMERVVLLEAVGQQQQSEIHRLTDAHERASEARLAIDAEIVVQQQKVAEMAKRKEQAEKALRAAGGGQVTGGIVGTSDYVAEPAPRNADGSLPAETCSVTDPTTGGCITPRMLHAYNQARAAGFTRYTSCKRSGGGGEHPLGRACDFSASTNTFLNVAATGGDKTYGNNLTAMLVNNASRLGVLYVIWYRQIWMPGSGWRSYSGSGSAAAEHTNHLHLSVY